MPLFASHIHFSKKLISKHRLFRNNLASYRLALAGSILPDLDLIKGLNINTHGKCKGFYDYLKRVDPRFAPLGWGMYVHELLDGYTDKAIINKKSTHAIKILKKFDHGIEGRKDMIAHLLLEHSVENILLRKNPWIIKELSAVRKKFNVRRLAKHLYDFFGCDKKAVKKALWLFKKVNLKDFRTDKGIILLWINYSFLMTHEEFFKDFHSKFKVLKNTILLKRNYHKYKKEQLKKIRQTEMMFAEAQEKIGDIHKELDKAAKHIEKVLFKKS